MKLEALDHPKTLDFASRLGVELPTAIGYLELFWAFTGKKAPQGNVGKWPNGAISMACYWRGSPDVFVAALTDAGFLTPSAEHRLLVHDWHDHAQSWVRAKLAKLKLQFLTLEPTSEPTRERSSEGTKETSVASSEPSTRAPVPSQAKGSQAKPSQGKQGSVSSATPTGDVRQCTDAETPNDSDAISRVFEHWRETHGHQRSKLDRKRRDLIRRALAEHSEADLCQSISGYRNSPYHMGRNDTGTVYDDIEVMLRDAKHIDAGLKFYAEPPSSLSAATRRLVAATEDWQPPEVRRAAN